MIRPKEGKRELRNKKIKALPWQVASITLGTPRQVAEAKSNNRK